MNAYRACMQWANRLERAHWFGDDTGTLVLIHRLLSLLPEDYHAEYAGALHLKVSGEWSIHPSTAFATLTADPEVMLEVLADLLRAHPECRPRLPKAITT